MRQIEIQIGENTIIATLLDDKAPKTCNALWNALPIETTVHQAKMAGGEMFWVTPSMLVQEDENPVKNYAAEIGMLCYYWPLAEVEVFYSPPSYEPVDIMCWGKVETIDELVAAGRRCWLNGTLGRPGDKVIMRRKK